MKTRIYLLSFMLLTIVLSGCYEDKGNYNYTANEEITIDGLEEKYDAIAGGENLVIEPTVKSSAPGAKFTYKWDIYETNVQGYAPALELISEEKNLNYAVDKEAKRWMLVFYVTNTMTGYTKVKEIPLDVATEYTRGWYVLKDNETKSDLDLFLTTESVLETSKTPIENILLKVNNRQLNGKAVKLNMGTSYKIYSPVADKYINTRSLMIVANKDMAAVPISTMKIARDITNICYAPFDVINLQSVIISNTIDQFLLNDGQLHTLYNMSANIGVYGKAKLMDDKGTPYRLSKFIVPGSAYVFFDELSSSFVIGDSMNATLIPVAKSETSPLDVANNNLECIYMGSLSNSAEIYGVFKDKTTGIKGIYYLEAPYRAAFTFSLIKELTPDDKMYHADLFTMLLDEQFLYFEAEGKIWSCNLVNGVEKEEFTIPVGEKLAVLRVQRSLPSKYGDDEQYTFDYVAIGTNMNGKYKFRMFEKNAGSLNPEPTIEFGGNGNCGDIIYISPKVTTAAIPFY